MEMTKKQYRAIRQRLMELFNSVQNLKDEFDPSKDEPLASAIIDIENKIKWAHEVAATRILAIEVDEVSK